MKIIRNGIEYELTNEEMRNAYHVMRMQYFKEDVESQLEDICVELSDDDIQKIAVSVEKALGNNDSYWESYWMTIEYLIKDYIK